MKRILYTLSALLLLLAVGACDGNDAGSADIINDPPPDPDPPVETVGVWNSSSWDGCTWGQ